MQSVILAPKLQLDIRLQGGKAVCAAQARVSGSLEGQASRLDPSIWHLVRKAWDNSGPMTGLQAYALDPPRRDRPVRPHWRRSATQVRLPRFDRLVRQSKRAAAKLISHRAIPVHLSSTVIGLPPRLAMPCLIHHVMQVLFRPAFRSRKRSRCKSAGTCAIIWHPGDRRQDDLCPSGKVKSRSINIGGARHTIKGADARGASRALTGALAANQVKLSPRLHQVE